MAEKWQASGDFFDACTCDQTCPCIFLSPPTEGYCDAVVAWHVERGTYGNVKLDGLNVVMAGHWPGKMIDGGASVALYVDEKGSEEQREALAQIFSGQAGGPPAALAALIGEVLGVGPAPIEYKIEGKKGSLRVGNIAEAEVEEVEGAEGQRVEIHNAPFGMSNPLIQGKALHARFNDKGLSFSIAEKNSYIGPFAYEGP
jgi:hypothetical protein